MSILDNDRGKEVEEIGKRKLDRDNNDLKKLLAQVEFRRFAWRLLMSTGLYKNSFTGNSHTFYYEGQRMVGLRLLNMIMNANPRGFSQMQQEHYSEKVSEEMILQRIQEDKK